MKKISSENLNYLLIGILSTLIIGGIVVGITFKFSSTSSQKESSSDNRQNPTSLPSSSPSSEGPSDSSDISSGSKNETPIPSIAPTLTIVPTTPPNTPVPSSNPPISSSSELGVVQYFEQGFQEVEQISSEDVPFREKAKNTFTNIIDFIFYGKEIGGYTFQGLTNEAKLKIITLALKIDHSIDQHFPNYKDKVKDKYASFKGKLAVMYLEATQKLCETVGESTCNQAKEDFETMKESFGFTWSLLKELAKSGKEKISDFYLNWRNS